MKKSTILFLVFPVYFACRSANKDKVVETDTPVSSLQLEPTFNELRLNKKVKAAIDSFILETNCSDCIHEIYINKILPDSMIITLKARVYNTKYLENVNPLFTTKIDSCDFYVYTGLEDVLEGNKKFTLPVTDSANDKWAQWSLLIKRDSLYVLREGYPPFFPGEPPHVEIIK